MSGLIAHWLRRIPTSVRAVEQSLLCRKLSGLYPRLQRGVRGSRICSMLCNLIPWDFGTVSGLVFLLCYLCPGILWRNQYGLLGALALFLLALYRGKTLAVSDVGAGLLLFTFACAVGVGCSADRAEGVRVFCFYATAVLFPLALRGGITSRCQLRRLLGFVYATLVLTGAVAVCQRIQGVAPNASLTDLTVNAGMPGRVYATMENPNNYAEFLVLFLPLGFSFCASARSRRPLLLLGLAVPVAALLMTYSRSGWVSFALSAVIFVGLWNRRWLPILAALAVAAVPLLPESIFRRILTIGSTADSSNAYRLYIWAAAVAMLSRYGLTGLGLGPGNFTPVYANYCLPQATVASHSHAVWLELWLEMGILGIVGFVSLYAGAVRRGLRARHTPDPALRLILTACVSALCGIAFSATVEYIFHYPRVLFGFFILLGITLTAASLTCEA